uniref:Ribosomal protein L34 n=1 Tax=Cyanidium sp. THAL103 TaxID=3027999 RepID=A0A9Y1I437_9RHOD|nr:ribosomal protein L34 [Cyanidium sp. THAL103]
MTKRTLEGTKRKKRKTSGFRSRMKIKSGKKIINSRRRKKRYKLIKI